MGIKQTDGTFVPDTRDYMVRGATDAQEGRSTAVASVPGSSQAAYTEGFNYGVWFKLQLNRSVI